jgi:hypothetical protein
MVITLCSRDMTIQNNASTTTAKQRFQRNMYYVMKLECNAVHMQRLEVFLAPYEVKAGLGVHVALDVEGRTKNFGSTEEDTSLGGGVNFADGFEDHIPVRSAKVCGRAETGDGVLFGIGVVDHDVGCIVGLDLGGEILHSR